MGEPARKLEPEDQRPLRRARPDLRLVVSSAEIDECEAWVLEAIMACYCSRHRQD